MGIKQHKLDLASFIVEDFKDFDPAHSDSPASLNLDGLFDDGGSGRGMRGETNGASPAGTPGSTPSANPAASSAKPGPGPL